VEVIIFTVVLGLWIAFIATFFFPKASIRDIRAWFNEQSLVLQVPLGILFLPWVIGMWIWGDLVAGGRERGPDLRTCLGERICILALDADWIVARNVED
jgi:hypothetical protein